MTNDKDRTFQQCISFQFNKNSILTSRTTKDKQADILRILCLFLLSLAKVFWPNLNTTRRANSLIWKPAYMLKLQKITLRIFLKLRMLFPDCSPARSSRFTMLLTIIERRVNQNSIWPLKNLLENKLLYQ